MSEAFPLHWPAGWPRASHRSRAQFNALGTDARDPGDAVNAALARLGADAGRGVVVILEGLDA